MANAFGSPDHSCLDAVVDAELSDEADRELMKQRHRHAVINLEAQDVSLNVSIACGNLQGGQVGPAVFLGADHPALDL